MPGKSSTKVTEQPANASKAFDWSGLKVEETDEKITREAKSNRLDGTPFVGWVTEAVSTGRTKVLAGLPKDNATDAVTLIRLAAKQVDTGIRVKTSTDSRGLVTIRFQASKKKEFTPAKSTRCPVCNKMVTVRNKDGKIRPHGPRGANCAGSDREPTNPVS